MVHLIRFGMPLTSTMDSRVVPFSSVSGGLVRHTRWMVSHSLYRDRSDAHAHAVSGGSGTSTERESLAIRELLGVLRRRLIDGLLGRLLRLVDLTRILALRLLVDDVASLVDGAVDSTLVLRGQVFQFVQKSHVAHPTAPSRAFGALRESGPGPTR